MFVRKYVNVWNIWEYLLTRKQIDSSGLMIDLISTADSKVKVAVIPTNEELAIARETVALV